MIPESPPRRKRSRKPTANSIGVRKRIEPPTIVPIRSKYSIPAGIAIAVDVSEKCWFVSLKDVRLFESEGNYVRVRFNDHKPLVLRSLNKLEEKLDPHVFFRANRKHIVNLKWVDNIQPWFSGGLMVKLKTGEEVAFIAEVQGGDKSKKG